MNQNTSTPDSSVPELLRCFEQELPQAPDAGAVLERYASLHPELASTLRELAEAIEMLRRRFSTPPKPEKACQDVVHFSSCLRSRPPRHVWSTTLSIC